ncbi:LANO_0D06612g1_1 [Lachancea nothofagi CBS 11611]|uniref:glutaminase n=1 Tax=Lachancea nothofagi CBS 11611 TaxID=1266666 RepID=A0A1G4JHK6_9SACH|nr:LANO_0D06612g1_1 [Lachancea nothofagi CBS 11611]
MKRVGVLALQGAFKEHAELIEACVRENSYSIAVCEVKTAEQLALCDALIIPGGESTAMSLIAQRCGIFEPLQEFVRDPTKAIWGTCAGLIFLAREITSDAQLVKPLGALSVAVQRNAFGRQSHSFVAQCDFSSFMVPNPKLPQNGPFPTVFIRAPVIDRVLDPANVQILHEIQSPAGHSLVVAVRQNNILGTSFHPELADDNRFHDWFLREFVIKE